MLWVACYYVSHAGGAVAFACLLHACLQISWSFPCAMFVIAPTLVLVADCAPSAGLCVGLCVVLCL